MKKFFYLAVAALVVFAGCSKNTLDPQSQKAREINFNTVASKATRAPLTGSVYSYNCPSFGVFASYLEAGKTWTANKATATRYMDNVEIEFDDVKDIWAPTSTYYWPLEGSLSFIAYSPYDAATASFAEATGTLTLTAFTVNTTVADQVDLLYSSVNADRTQNESYYLDSANSKSSQSAEGDKGVNIQFKHALSQVIFKAKTADEVYAAGMSFKIDTIVVNAASTADNMTVVNPAEADLAATITTWNNPKTNANFVVRTEDFPNETYAAGAANFLTDQFSAQIGDALLMIPVTAFATTDPTVTIKYTLYRLSDALAMGSKTVTVHFDDVDDEITNWQAGKKYTYNLTIDLQKIYFNPTVTDWADGGSQSVDVPNDARL